MSGGTEPCGAGFPPVVRSLGPVAAAAVVGNAFVRREDLQWFSALRRPRMQLPQAGFFVVAALYYACIGAVVHRSLARNDRTAHRLALVVLAGNEAWNLAFFRRRSTRTGFLGLLGFTVPVCLLQATLTRDRVSALLLGPYTAWVLCYDVPWAYQLWRLNR